MKLIYIIYGVLGADGAAVMSTNRLSIMVGHVVGILIVIHTPVKRKKGNH